MRQRSADWLLVSLVAAVSVLATLLAVNLLRSESPYAYGQGTDLGAIRNVSRSSFGQVSEGAAGYIAALTNTPDQSRMPLLMIDTKSQTILIYEYDQSRRVLYLRAVRSFRNDRELEDASFGRSATKGPTVEEVREILRDPNKLKKWQR